MPGCDKAEPQQPAVVSRNGLQWGAATACSREPQRPAVESRNGLQSRAAREPQRPTVESRNGLLWRAAMACNGEPPLCCFECVQRRNDLHNDSCQVAVLGELADKLEWIPLFEKYM